MCTGNPPAFKRSAPSITVGQGETAVKDLCAELRQLKGANQGRLH
jgi:hypothetical protein